MGAMRPYLRARNSVEGTPFELSLSLPKPFWDDERLGFVRRFAQEKPESTLRDFCERLQQEEGLSVTNSQMFRALKQLGLRRKERLLPQIRCGKVCLQRKTFRTAATVQVTPTPKVIDQRR